MIGLVWHNASWWPLFGGLLGVAGVVFILGWRLRRNQRSLLPGVFATTRSIRPLFTFLGSLLVGVAILDPVVQRDHRASLSGTQCGGSFGCFAVDAFVRMRPRIDCRWPNLLGELAESVVGDRFGLIAFAGTPVPKCPPTADPRAFRRALRQIDPQHADWRITSWRCLA